MKTIILDGGWLCWLEIYYIRLKMLRKEVLGKTARETKQILCPSFTKALGGLLDSADGNHTFERVQVKAQAKSFVFWLRDGHRCSPEQGERVTEQCDGSIAQVWRERQRAGGRSRHVLPLASVGPTAPPRFLPAEQILLTPAQTHLSYSQTQVGR